jgi:hypothetical protein
MHLEESSVIMKLMADGGSELSCSGRVPASVIEPGIRSNQEDSVRLGQTLKPYSE